MSKGSAVVAILIAFVGGLAIGNMVGERRAGGGEDGTEVAGDEGQGALPPNGPEEADRYFVPVTREQPAKGPADALVTIVLFSDFQCPFCSRVGPTLERVMNEYRGKVRVVWRNQPLPFHQNAMPAAEAAMEAFEQGGSEKFWRMHDLLFQNQQALARPDLERYAQQLGLDMTKFRRALDQHTHQAAIQADQQLAGSVGANGTPASFVNGKQLMGAVPFEQFKTLIDAELANAERLVSSGTPRNQVYSTIIRNGRRSAGPPPGAQPQQPQQAPPRPDPNAVYRVPLQGNEPQKGPNDALVTIVEFSDFECPFCGRVEPTITQLMRDYGNDLRVVWMNNPLPFHQNATPAANAALEAMQQGGSAKFWAMHEKLFSNQQGLTRENMERYAQELGLNMAQFRAALDNNEHRAAIEQQQTLARGLGASGTPSFFINGRNLRGAQPIEAFKAVIDEELRKARTLVQQGTPRAQVYARTIANGATAQVMLPGAAPSAQPAQPQQPPPDQVYNIPVPRTAPSKGPANAQVTIQLFSDFQCPFCSRVNPTLEQVEREYGNRVRIVWRDYPLPFHQNAMPAAIASREVFRQGGNAKFWAYHALLFQNQQDLSRATLERLAQQAGGISMQQFRAALDGNTHQAAVQADMDAVRQAGAQIGTPSSFINGRLLQGAQPFEAFKAAIDRALAERH